MKYVSIPAKKCLAQRKNSSLPVTLRVFRYTLEIQAPKAGVRPHGSDGRTLKENSLGDLVLTGNLITILDNASELVILAIGMTLVTAASGGQDISVGSGSPSHASGAEMNAIASSIIGGTMLTGGVGNIIGTLFGVLSLSTIKNIVSSLGLDEAWWTNITVAAMICLFLVIQSLVLSRKNKNEN